MEHKTETKPPETDARLLDEVKLNPEHQILLGMFVSQKHAVVQLLLDWAEKRTRDILREMNGLATNPDIPDRILMVELGNMRLAKEVKDFLRVCELKWKRDEAAKEEKKKRK